MIIISAFSPVCIDLYSLKDSLIVCMLLLSSDHYIIKTECTLKGLDCCQVCGIAMWVSVYVTYLFSDFSCCC